MKERPILFSAPMVRAILEGRKTQTRRIVKLNESGRIKYHGKQWHPEDHECVKGCKYGQPGDRLWVREAWRIGAWLEDHDPRIKLGAIAVDYIANGYAREEWLTCDHEDLLRYRSQSIDDATKSGLVADKFGCFDWEHGKGPCRIRPSIHMPQFASRISLEITGIRVERLNDINEEDCKNEGLSSLTKDGRLFKYGIPDKDGLPGNDDYGWHWQEWNTDPRRAYRILWEKINGAGSWEVNPMVWVIEFKRMTI